MKNYKYLIGIAFWLMGSVTISAQVSNNNEDEVNKVDSRFASQDFVPGQVLVKFKDENRVTIRRAAGKFASTSIDKVTEVLKKYGAGEVEQLLPNENPNRQLRRVKAYNGEVIQEHDLSQLYCVTLSAEHQQEVAQVVDELKMLDEVEFAEPNYRVYAMADTHIADDYSGNPMEGQQWYLDAYGVKELWNKPIINKERPVIAILDTGVDLTHPDLKDNIWTNKVEEYGTQNKDNDGNGFNNDVHGWDFVNNTPNIRDNNMHGTHVAGIAAAANNGIGIVGANPQALIMPITVLQSDGAGDIAKIIKGIDYAIANGATVINMSLGLYSNSNVLRQTLENAYSKAVLVAAAGNNGNSICSQHRKSKYDLSIPCFPAAYSIVLGVQATNIFDEITDWSNYDNDGAFFSCVTSYADPDGFNYELKAPGRNILSTIPGGNYKQLNGTSMAAPLVAGAVSALKMVKQYDTQEMLWVDLLHTNNVAEAYQLTDRPVELEMQRIILRERKELTDLTEDDYSGDNEVDAGETISIYPVIRSTFGAANDIKLKVMVDEFEDPDIVEIINGEVDFGFNLDAYGKGVSKNPLVLKIPNKIAEARHVRLKMVVTWSNKSIESEHPFTLVAHNMIKIHGLINENQTLTADHIYYVNNTLGINNGCTLTIEPGTRLEFGKGVMLKAFGKLIAKGTKEKPIVFTGHLSGEPWDGIYTNQYEAGSHPDTISYCRIEHCDYKSTTIGNRIPYMQDCVLYSINGGNGSYTGESNVIMNSNLWMDCKYTNIINNNLSWGYGSLNNFFNNYDSSNYMLLCSMSYPGIVRIEKFPSYLGTSREELIRPFIYELGNGKGTWGTLDLSNMPKEPYSEAHGIVWKVLVNGKDAQDEFEDLAPLGVGKHKFEVYFNRPMNKAVAPQISFGVRAPYTQQSVAENGSWNEKGTIYTAYKTITGKTNSDGINRIYVQGAEDDEFFPCPYEKTRFNVIVQVAGSMATGFEAEAGLGRICLKWNNEDNNFEDAMGFNVYRYHQQYYPAGYRDDGIWHPAETVVDTIRINQDILETEVTEIVDYDVVPGETYYYYYKVLSTDLQEFDISNVVAATPLTSTRGDANASGSVDVADVITTVNYITKQDPQPFIFEAADMNEDKQVDILDVMSIIKGILNPNLLASSQSMGDAVYTIEDGTLYVESPVALAGIQVQLALNEELRVKNEEFATAEDLNGFEHVSVWLSDNDYLFLAYNLNGKTLTPGKHALLHIGDAMIADIRLSDAGGHNVNVVGDEATKVNRIVEAMTVKGIYDLQGRKLTGDSEQERRLPKGIYIINGRKVVR